MIINSVWVQKTCFYFIFIFHQFFLKLTYGTHFFKRKLTHAGTPKYQRVICGTITVVYFDQPSGAGRTWKLVEIHNRSLFKNLKSTITHFLIQGQLVWQYFTSNQKKNHKDGHISTIYQAHNCWWNVNIPLMYNLVLWNRFLVKKKKKL